MREYRIGRLAITVMERGKEDAPHQYPEGTRRFPLTSAVEMISEVFGNGESAALGAMSVVVPFRWRKTSPSLRYEHTGRYAGRGRNWNGTYISLELPIRPERWTPEMLRTMVPLHKAGRHIELVWYGKKAG